jgi:hypothetical protein
MESAEMGLVYAEIELLRGADVILVEEGLLEESQLRRCTVRALVDSGVTMLTIPDFVRSQLQLRKRCDRHSQFQTDFVRRNPDGRHGRVDRSKARAIDREP